MYKGGVVWDLIKVCKAKKQYNGDNVRLFKNHAWKEADGLIKYNIISNKNGLPPCPYNEQRFAELKKVR